MADVHRADGPVRDAPASLVNYHDLVERIFVRPRHVPQDARRVQLGQVRLVAVGAEGDGGHSNSPSMYFAKEGYVLNTLGL